MDLTQMLAKTRRLLNERTARLWQDSDITTEINNALYEAEARVALIAPAEFQKGATRDLVAGQTLYERPTREPIQAVRVRAATGAPSKGIRKLTAEQMQDDVDGSPGVSATRGAAGYALIGKYLYLLPAPPENVTAGLVMIYHEKVALAASTDEPRLPVALHHRICYRAALLCLKDSKDISDEGLAKLEAEWEPYFGASREAEARLRRDHYFDRQPYTFTPTVVWAS